MRETAHFSIRPNILRIFNDFIEYTSVIISTKSTLITPKEFIFTEFHKIYVMRVIYIYRKP